MGVLVKPFHVRLTDDDSTATPRRSMSQFNSPFIRRTALVVLSVSTASCASLGNFILTGHWEDPNAQEVSTLPKSTPTNSPTESAPTAANNTDPAKSAPEPDLQSFPAETPFTYGIWSLYRNSHGLFFWTGKGDTLRLFAVELGKSEACWTTRRADGPRVMHCLDKHYVLARDLKPEAGTQEGPPSATRDALNGLPNPPWRNDKLTATNLTEGKYDLPEMSGGKNGTLSLEATASSIKIQLPPLMGGERWFVIPKDTTNVLFAGERASLYDGCTNPDKTIGVYPGMGIQLDKRTCGIEADINDFRTTITIGNLALRFKVLENPPNLAKVQEDVAKLRKLAAEKKSPIEINVGGNATYTLVTAKAKKPNGEAFGYVESDRTIGNEHFQCSARFEGADTAMLPMAKQICMSMRAMP